MHTETKDTNAYTVDEIREQFIESLAKMSYYWNSVDLDDEGDDETGQSPYTSSWLERIDGFVNTFHTACAGWYPTLPFSFNMEATHQDRWFAKMDINDESLNFVQLRDADFSRRKFSETNDLLEQYRLLWHIKLADIADAVNVLDISGKDKTFRFVGEMLEFVEFGDENFAFIDFVVSMHSSHPSFTLSEGKRRYASGTTFTRRELSLKSLYLAEVSG